jgi:metal-dependent amidase/aminoacylase/carboxypeptidase family protein
VTEAISSQGYTVLDNQPPQLVSEDFACLSQKAPGCIFGLGAGNADKRIIEPPHSPRFDIDEDCLLVGINSMLSIYQKAIE